MDVRNLPGTPIWRRVSRGRRPGETVLGALVIAAVGAFALAPAASHADAATAGTLFGWGNTLSSEISVTDSTAPTVINDVASATSGAVGGRDAFLVAPSGLLGVGPGGFGWLGLGEESEAEPTTFTAIPGTAGATQVSAGEDSTLVLAGGTVLAFGQNDDGEAGAAPGTIVGTPTAVPGLTGTFTQVASGKHSSYALRADGTVWAWGANTSGQLGGTSGNTGTPLKVQGLPGPVKEIAPGTGHVLALLEDGTVWAWGENFCGEVGDGSEGGNVTTPVQVLTPPPGTSVTGISAGSCDSFALLSNGTFEAWGSNEHGELGLGLGSNGHVDTPTTRAAPSSIYPSGGFTAIAAGQSATYGIGVDGHVYAWGDNTYGELGSNTYNYAFPYTGAPGGFTQKATEIPQKVGQLSEASWLAEATSARGQIVSAASPLRFSAGGSTGGDPRTTTTSQFATQPVGTLGFTHLIPVESIGVSSDVTAVRVAGLDRRDFLVVGYGERELPFTIDPLGSHLEIEVRFAPTAVGPATATLEVVSSDSGTISETLEGYGVELPGNTPGVPGAQGAAGPAGPVGAPGQPGAAGPAGRNGVVVLSATRSKVTARRGTTARLGFLLVNGTTGRLAGASVAASVPKGLGTTGATTGRIAALGAGASRHLAIPLRIDRRAELGTQSVRVVLKVDGKTVKRTVKVKVTP